MFSEFNGLPLHPLAVHAAVVLVPLAALMGVLFAVPRTRAWSRLPLLATSIGAVVAVFVARQSGKAFEKTLHLQGDANDLIQEHKHRANLLLIVVIVFAVIAIAAYVLTRVDNVSATVTNVLAVLLVIGAIGVAFQTYRVGDIGSRAVWNPSGQVDYGSDSGD